MTGEASSLSSMTAGRLGFACPTSSYVPPAPVYPPQPDAAPRLAASRASRNAAAAAVVVAAAAWALAGSGGGGGGGPGG